MSKKAIWILVGLVLVGAGTVAYFKFTGTTKHLAFIPKSSEYVLRIDAKSLANKLELKGEFKNTLLYKKELQNEIDGKGGSLMTRIFRRTIKDHGKVGIDVFSDFYYFETKVDDESYSVIVGALSNQDNFKETVQKMPGAKEAILNDKTFTYYGKKNEILAWNSVGFLHIEKKYAYFDMWGYGDKKEVPMVDVARKLFTLKEADCIKSDKAFNEFADEDADLAVYVNYASLFGESFKEKNKYKDKEISTILNAVSEMKVGFFLNFESDKIVLNSNFYGDKSVFDKYYFMKEKGLSDEALSAVTDKNLLALYAFNIEPSKLQSLIDLANKISKEDGERYSESYGGDHMRKNFEENVNEGLKPLGLNLKQMISALGGEMTVAAVGFKTYDKEDVDYQFDPLTNQYERVVIGVRKEQMPVFTGSVSFKDQNVLNKVYNALPLLDSASAERGFLMPYNSDFIIYAVPAKGKLFLSNDKVLADKMRSKGKLDGKIEGPAKDLAKDYAGSMYVDLNTEMYKDIIGQLAGNSNSDKKESDKFMTYMKMFKDIQMTSKGYNGEMVINLTESRGNALFRLVKQADVFFKD